jgi:hypothetical protein
LALAGCSQGIFVAPAGTAVTPDDSENSVALTFGITLNATFSAPVAGAVLTATAQNGVVPPIVTQAACAPSGCTVTASAPPEYDDVSIALTDASGATLETGAVDVDAGASGAVAIPVAFGGTPASAQLSLDPVQLTIGTVQTAQLSVVAYDALGNELIGDIPFATPIALTTTGETSDTTLGAMSITAPEQLIALNYDGADVSSFDVSPSTPNPSGDVEVTFVDPPSLTPSGDAQSDVTFPTARSERWSCDGPKRPAHRAGLRVVRRAHAVCGRAVAARSQQRDAADCRPARNPGLHRLLVELCDPDLLRRIAARIEAHRQR